MNLSFHNDPALKALHVAQAEQHAAQDMLLSGTYGDTENGKFRGCSVGCFAHDIDPSSYDHHVVVAEARGLPEWLIRLQDSMFEGLPAEDRPGFHVELARRIPVGVDLTPVPHLIAVARIDRLLETQRQLLAAGHPEQVTAAIQQVITALEVGRRAHEAAAAGDSCQLDTARSAESAAESAAAWSARSAAESAWSAAAWSARSAARSARQLERDALFAALATLERSA